MTAASSLRRVLAVVLALVVALVGSMSLSATAAEAATTPATTSTIGSQTPEALSVTVAGSGFSGEAPGLYVSLAPEGTSSTTDASQYLGTQWVQASQIVSGEFTTTVSLSAEQIATLDPATQYVVHTMKAHGQAAIDPSQTTATPIALDFVALGLTPAPQEPEDPDAPENPGTPEDPETPGTPGTPEEPSAPTVPQVSVSETSVSASGQTTVTVSGSGFDPLSSIAANRPPLAGKPGGVYVAFGKFAESWKPSAGAARGSRPAVGSQTKWAVLAEDMATVGGPSAGAIELRSDGSFTTQIVLEKAAADTAAAELESGNYGIYTYPGGGAVTPAFETYTPITFTVPQVSVSETSVSASGQTTVTVSGSGFDPLSSIAANRPPLAGKPGGVYVAFGKFAESWKPSAGAARGSRPAVGSQTKWAVLAEDMATVGGPSAGAIELRSDGSFTTQIVLEKAAADTAAAELESGRYGIYTYPGGGAVTPAFETYTPIMFEPPVVVPVTPSTSSTITAQSADGLSVDVVGSGFSGAAPGLYVSLAVEGTTSTTDASQYLGTTFVMPMFIANGTFSTTITLTKEQVAALDSTTRYVVHTMKAHGQAATDPSQTTATPIALDFGLLQPGGPTDPEPEPPVTPPVTPPTTPVVVTSAGYLQWGVSASFARYVTGTTAKGSISVSAGASSGGAGFRFPQTGSTADAAGVGSTSYAGRVSFSGHAGALALSFGDPIVAVESATRGSLSVTVNGGARATIATLDLSRATRTSSSGVTTFAGAPATLTSAGEAAFSGFYQAGQALDPVTFAIGSNVAAGSFAPARTVAAAAAATAFVPPATPPATTGISVPADVDLENVTPGQEITFTATGFRPNETGIKVVVYSDPIVLDEDAAADATGAVTWTGSIPASLEPGRHTLTFQGSVDRGIEFTVVALAQIGGCEVEDAAATWGVKESFRSYVSGSIANGDWTTSGNISYTTPEFDLAAGTGAFDTETKAGQIDFTGSIAFTGHDGALAVTFADPSIRFADEDTALLVVDVTAADRAAAEAGDTAATTTQDVAFAELDLAAAPLEESGGAWSASDVPTTLTAAGHAVFSTYETGDELDPIDVEFSTGIDCAPADDVASASETTSASVGGDGSGTTWWPWAVGGALLVALAAGGALAVARRRSA
ncbi:MAG: HtaA domain-containing protein [Aeromicrobium sp.]|uniref:HtaA domain-containing protein n=1 Tax=Aeromicrobium sp. TaxID=1871063 RepID=UPI00261A4698|nr:HtaA domain-containing protein [Aeromicrobium sp.]MDF1705368.1 HtaA domain-containing protein [Aeromicrobium sp.]